MKITETRPQSGNRRRYSQRRRGNGNKSNSNLGNNQPKNNNKPKQRELIFHLHDSTLRKTTESFNKIRVAIIIKIEKAFEDSLDIINSVETNTKKTCNGLQAAEAATTGTAKEKARTDCLSEKKWEIMLIRYQEKINKFGSLLVKTHALILDQYCSKEIKATLQEMPDFDSAIKKKNLLISP